MKWWRELVVENPMTVETKRFRNRFFTPGRMSTFNTLVLIIGAIGFFILTLISLTIPGFGAEMIVYSELFILSLLIPAMTHGAVAAEREKGTWDVLMTAPVSRAQVIMGKFIGAAYGILLVWILLWIPTLLAYVTSVYGSNSYTSYMPEAISFWALALGKLDVLLYGLALAAFCILISARSRRAFGAFFIAFGIIFFVLVVFPSMISSVSMSSMRGVFLGIGMAWHPFFALMHVFSVGRNINYYNYDPYDDYSGASGEDLTQTFMLVAPAFFSIFFTIVFLIWASHTIRFLDFETRFLPRSKDAPSQ
ncbi:MAG: ABC transporter permease [Fimbriimonadaceae bacterium]|nr:ABC transporter permease [Fimbriimonadaceae bacterium]